MHSTNFFTLTFILFTFFNVSGQNSSLNGKVIDGKTKETVIAAVIKLVPSDKAVESDYDGNYSFTNIAPGNYSITVDIIGYSTKTINNVTLVANQTKTLDIDIQESAEILENVTIQAVRKTDTDNALVNEIQRVDNIVTGVSSQQITKTQDRDASQVVKRVPGISLNDDRFIIIRGLNERYNTVLINDIPTPSTEVDVRSFSFDLVPSNAIDRMLVYKSPSAELPADMTGGAVKLYTKSVADDNHINLSFNVGHRMGTTGLNVYDASGNSGDIFGFGASKRQLPNTFASTKTVLNNARSINVIDQFTKLNPFYDTKTKIALPDLRFSINGAKKWKLGSKDLSTVSYISYSNTHANNHIEQNRYLFDESVQSSYSDISYSNNVRLSAMSNWTLSLDKKTKLHFKNIFNQLATKETVTRLGSLIENGVESSNEAYRYEQKSILSSQLIGTRELNQRTKIKVIGSLGYTLRAEPDFRRYTSSRPLGGEGAYNFNLQQFESPTLQQAARFWSNLDEYVFTGLFSGETVLGQIMDDENANTVIKYGVSSEYKDRYFNARWFGLVNTNRLSTTFTSQPADKFFDPSLLGPQSIYYAEGTNFDDKYTAQNMLNAAYANLNKTFGKNISFSGGVRVEHNDQSLQSKQRGSGAALNVNVPTIKFLPSVNVGYKVNETQGLRFAYGVTVNRPEFREMAPFTYYDFLFDVSRRGNSEIKPATIHNLDLRYEIYPSNGQMITIGAFYKKFINPIEGAIFYNGSGIAFTVMNAESAEAFGAELEIRKQVTKSLMVVFNGSLIQSDVKLNQGESLSRYLQGQSPFIVNTGLFYQHESTGLQANVMYNVVGKRINVIGDNIISASIYEMPRNVIDANISKKIGIVELKLGVQDLLNQPFKLVQDTNRDGKITDTDGVFQSFRRGTQSFLNAVIKF